VIPGDALYAAADFERLVTHELVGTLPSPLPSPLAPTSRCRLLSATTGHGPGGGIPLGRFLNMTKCHRNPPTPSSSFSSETQWANTPSSVALGFR